jgi:hypothetical protein
MGGGVSGLRPMSGRRRGNRGVTAKEISDISGQIRGQLDGGGGKWRRNWRGGNRGRG